MKSFLSVLTILSLAFFSSCGGAGSETTDDNSTESDSNASE